MKAFSINRSQLKIFAIAFMFISHALLTSSNAFVLYVQSFVNAFTMPIMLWLFMDTIEKTSNLKKLFIRLLIFALVTQFAFNYYLSGYVTFFYTMPLVNYPFLAKWFLVLTEEYFNVFFTFLICLMVVKAGYFFHVKWVKYTVLSLFFVLSLQSDWGFAALVASLYIKSDNTPPRKLKGILLFFLTATLFNFVRDFVTYYVLMVINSPEPPHGIWFLFRNGFLGHFVHNIIAAPICCLILRFYDRDLPVKKNWFFKYFFYFFYPLQFIIIRLFYDFIR